MNRNKSKSGVNEKSPGKSSPKQSNNAKNNATKAAADLDTEPAAQRAPAAVKHYGQQKRKTCLVVAIGVALRIAIWKFAAEGNAVTNGVSDAGITWITEEVRLTSETPLTSYSSLQEAKALIQLQKSAKATPAMTSPKYRSFSPYVNDIVRVPPLILYLLDSLQCLDSRFKQFLFLLSIEVLTALVLGLTVSHLQQARDSRIDLSMHIEQLEEPPIAATVTQASAAAAASLSEPKQDLPPSSNVSAVNAPPVVVEQQPRRYLVDLSAELIQPWMIIAIYVLSPINVWASLSLSLDPLRLFFLSIVFAFSVSGCNVVLSSLSLSLFAYVVPLPSVIGIGVAAGHAIAAVKKSLKTKDPFKPFLPISLSDYFFHYWILNIVPLLLSAVVGFSLLHLISFNVMNQSWDYWDSCVTAVLTVRDLTPNLGIFWYLLQLVFLRFRYMYIGIYQLVIVVISIPLSLKFIRQPLGLMQVLLSAALLFHPYPTVIDFSFIVIIYSIDMSVIRKFQEFTTFVVLICFTLSVFPIMANLWLRRNSGNPNFLYAAQLAFNTVTSFLIGQFAKASIRLHTGDDARFVKVETGEVKQKRD